ncbi:MAG: Hsp20/alpha crystallin family protein [Candidatus Kaiserbacteria bacterium]|nr:Hsp20/alpha crystallin family protein [Candidatus Kaiserbacteria bacterium]
MTTKRSFFDRLSGNISAGDAFDSFDDELPTVTAPVHKESRKQASGSSSRPAPLDDDLSGSEGQLPVDVHQTASDIIVRAFVAGVRPDELSISISRDMVEIGGSRMEREQTSGSDYFTRELFWGSFSRAIMLPQEVDVEASSASAKDGLLTIILPKLDKARQTKLRVKAG